jgi:hypothetical protein
VVILHIKRHAGAARFIKRGLYYYRVHAHRVPLQFDGLGDALLFKQPLACKERSNGRLVQKIAQPHVIVVNVSNLNLQSVPARPQEIVGQLHLNFVLHSGCTHSHHPQRLERGRSYHQRVLRNRMWFSSVSMGCMMPATSVPMGVTFSSTGRMWPLRCRANVTCVTLTMCCVSHRARQ